MNNKVGLAIHSFNCVVHCSYFNVYSLKQQIHWEIQVLTKMKQFSACSWSVPSLQVRALKPALCLFKKPLAGVLEASVAVALLCCELTPLLGSISVSYMLLKYFINCGLVQI